MRTCSRLLSVGLFLVALFAVSASAQTPREAVLVTPAWLAQHVTDANLVLLHIGDKAEYDAKHIAGARFVATNDIANSEPGGLSLQLPAADDLRQKLQALGISNNSRIVVYYGKDRVPQTTRVMFTLDAAGLGAQSSLLDGGMSAWERAGHPTTADVTPAKTGTLAPLTMKPIVVDADYVTSHLDTPTFRLIDARLPAFYDGTQTGGSAAARHKTGHIVGAKNVPFDSLTDATFNWKPAADLAAAFANAGVKAGDEVVAYCHIGQQATAVIFAARTLGITVKLYDGSFEDWSKRDGAVIK